MVNELSRARTPSSLSPRSRVSVGSILFDIFGSQPPGGSSPTAVRECRSTFGATGFEAAAIPFFSVSFLEHEAGPAARVSDYRLSPS